MILTWVCQFCGWANDNNNGACHNCEGETEARLKGGRWVEITVKQPLPLERQKLRKPGKP